MALDLIRNFQELQTVATATASFAFGCEKCQFLAQGFAFSFNDSTNLHNSKLGILLALHIDMESRKFEGMNGAQKARLVEDVLAILTSEEATFKGQAAVSWVQAKLRSASCGSAHRWRGLGTLPEFEQTLRGLGFTLSRPLKRDGTPKATGLIISV